MSSETAKLVLPETVIASNVEIVSPDDAKERGIIIRDPLKEIMIERLPQPKNLIMYEEPKNFINGKKLPKKRNRK